MVKSEFDLIRFLNLTTQSWMGLCRKCQGRSVAAKAKDSYLIFNLTAQGDQGGKIHEVMKILTIVKTVVDQRGPDESSRFIGNL